MITVIGSKGFIGSNLSNRLKELNIEYQEIYRNHPKPIKSELGDIIYCVGISYDFKSRIFDTVRADICYLSEILENYEFSSFTYLSSTRIYKLNSTIYNDRRKAREDDIISINPLDSDYLYNISKLTAESLLYSYSIKSGKKVKIARLSNVYGFNPVAEDFLTSTIRDAILNKKVIIKTSPSSQKDYINIKDVVDLLIGIASYGKYDIYNIASGINISNYDLIGNIKKYTGCSILETKPGYTVIFPEIDIDRLKREFYFRPSKILDDLIYLIREYGEYYDSNKRINS